MLGIAIDAIVLMVLLKTIVSEDVGIGTLVLLSLAVSIGTSLLAFGLATVMGVLGILVAAVIAAALLGVAVSALFGSEIKRSLLVGAIFMVVHLGVGIAFSVMLRA
jgi:hypothetical protein